MKKIYLLVNLVALLAATSSCNGDDPVQDLTQQQPQTPGGKVTVTASTGGAGTRIAFEDNEEEGIKLTWTEGDRITFYDDGGNYVATFTLTSEGGDTTGEFTINEGETITTDATYTVVYPGTDAATLDDRENEKTISGITQTTNGGTGHLNTQCYMKTTYTHSEETPPSISFVHEYAMITVVMDMPDGYTVTEANAPEIFFFINGSSSSTTTCLVEGITWEEGGPIKLYMMMAPCEGTERTLQFYLVCKDGTLFRKEVQSGVAYQAGARYTAGLTGDYKLEVTQGYTLDEVGSIPNRLNIWVITDVITDATDLNGLNSAIRGRNGGIYLKLPEATSIEARAFYDCKSLAGISLPAVTSIGTQTFQNCISLVNVSLPEGTSIGDDAFQNCYSLVNVSLPKVTSIGAQAFQNCTSLVNVSLPEATSIGDDAFAGCTSLVNVSLPKVADIGIRAFSSTGLIDVSLPEATNIGYYAFGLCTSLANVSLPKASSIGYYAFSGCTSLVDVSLPEATNIGYYAFGLCISLAGVSLPEAISLGEGAFDGCTSLVGITLPKATNIGVAAFIDCTSLVDISLPAVISIGAETFRGCTALASLEIATMSTQALTGVGLYLFNGVDVSKIDLIVGAAEAESNVTGLKWRSFSPFKSIIVQPVPTP